MTRSNAGREHDRDVRRTGGRVLRRRRRAGRPEDEHERAFEPGYSTAADGTVFGPSIVEWVAEQHGYEVRVAESDSGGARFEVTGVDFVE